MQPLEAGGHEVPVADVGVSAADLAPELHALGNLSKHS